MTKKELHKVLINSQLHSNHTSVWRTIPDLGNKVPKKRPSPNQSILTDIYPIESADVRGNRSGSRLAPHTSMDRATNRDWSGQEYLLEVSAEARRFRFERVADIIEGNTPLPLRPGLRTVLHIIPSHDLEKCDNFEAALSDLHKQGHLRPVFSSSAFAFRHDSSGCLAHNGLSISDSVGSYLRIFPNGALESVNTLPPFAAPGLKKQVPSLEFELRLLAAIPRYFNVLEILGVSLPVILGLSLVGVAGYSTEAPAAVATSHAQGGFIGSETLFLPEVAADDFAKDPGELLRSTFDAIWKAAGWEGAIFYHGSEWVGVAKR